MSVKEKVQKLISSSPVVIFSKTYCPYCSKAKNLYSNLQVPLKVYELDNMDDGNQIQDELYKLTKQSTVPSVWVNQSFVGGCDDSVRKHKDGSLFKLFQQYNISYKQ